MPCQSYDTNWADDSNDRDVRRLKKETDKLARIACRALEELERNGIEDMLLLKDDETREWWAKHKEADRKARAIIEERERLERVKQEALSKLSQEEKEVLGIATPLRKHKRARTSSHGILRVDEMVEKLYEDDDIPF
jgi:hypothetical protein